MTLDLGVVSSSLALGTELTLKQTNKQTNKQQQLNQNGFTNILMMLHTLHLFTFTSHKQRTNYQVFYPKNFKEVEKGLKGKGIKGEQN